LDGGAEIGGFEGPAETLKNLSLRREKNRVGDRFQRLELVERLRSRAEEGVSDTVTFCKDEETCSGGFIETDPENNEAARGELFIYSHEFRQFLGAGGTPCGPEVEKYEFSSKGGGIDG